MLLFNSYESMNAFCASEIVGHDLYFQSYDKYLMKLDLNTCDAEIVCDVKNSQYLHMIYAQYMCLLDKKLYLFDGMFHRIVSYHLDKRVCEIELNSNIDNNSGNQYLAVEKYNNVIFAFPRGTDCVIKIDSTISEKQYDVYADMDRENVAAFREGRRIFFLITSRNDLVVFDMQEERFFSQKVQSVTGKKFDIFIYKNKFFRMSSSGTISIWDMDKNCMINNVLVEDGFNELYFGKIIVTEKRVWILPGRGENIYVSDQNMNFCKYDNYPSNLYFRFDKETMKVRWKFFEYCEDDSFYYFAARSLNQILRINKRTGQEKWIEYTTPGIEGRINYDIEEYGMVIERERYLEKFVQMRFDFRETRE